MDTTFVEICEGESIILEGAAQTVSGAYIDNFNTSLGCDSTVVTVLTVNPVYNNTYATIICDGDSILLAGNYETTSGTYTDSLITINGCDSIINTVLTIAPNFTQSQLVELCTGDSLLVGGAYQTTAGTYLDTFMTVHGCDSIWITDIEMLPSYADSFEVHVVREMVQ